MSTGVDTKMCKIIVIDQPINSTIEFKQILGRGTRIREDLGKLAFDVLDFRGVVEIFKRPDFDGYPVAVVKVDAEGNQTVISGALPIPIPTARPADDKEADSKASKYIVSGVLVHHEGADVFYLDADGNPVKRPDDKEISREALARFITPVSLSEARSHASSEQEFIESLGPLKVWLALKGFGADDNSAADIFDGILSVAFGQEPLTRERRAAAASQSLLSLGLSEEKLKIAKAILEQYSSGGWGSLEDISVLRLPLFERMAGTPVEIMRILGGEQQYLALLDQIAAMVSKV